MVFLVCFILNRGYLCFSQVIKSHPPAVDIYQKHLIETGVMTKESVDKMHDKVMSILNEEFNNCKDYVPKSRDWLAAFWAGFKGPEQLSRVRNTGYIQLARFHTITSNCLVNNLLLHMCFVCDDSHGNLISICLTG